MKLSARLLISLLPAVIVIMAGYATWALAQRTENSEDRARSETRAFATAVEVALEHALRDAQLRDVQDILDEISRRPQAYGLFVYDTLGAATVFSEGMSAHLAIPDDQVLGMLASTAAPELERDLGGEPVFSVLRPLRARTGGEVNAVLEVVQSLSPMEEERVNVARRFVLNTLTLLVALVVLTVWLLRRLVDRPLASFIDTIGDVRQGDLSRRFIVTSGVRELDTVGQEFNRMAEALQSARDRLLTETEERMSLEARLREQDKLATMGTLAAGVAHQISAPLNVIEGRARLLLRRRPDPDKLASDLETITEQAGRIERIVRGLLDFARQPEPRIRRLDMATVVRGAAERFMEDFEDAGVRIRVDAPPTLEVLGDPDLLHEVMAVLVTNALDALREVGEGELALRVAGSGSEAIVEVADTGPGFADPDTERIFDAFFTTKPGGTGLGLAVARTIIEKLGGTMGARSEGGGLVWFRVPLAEGGPVD